MRQIEVTCIYFFTCQSAHISRRRCQIFLALHFTPTMSTKTETSSIPMPTESSAPPEFTAFSRLISIPLISSSLAAISETLTSNVYTRSPYSTAKGISTSAYKYTEPIQLRFAPLIVRVDGFANQAVDVVESKYPRAFTTKPEEVVSFVRERRASASKAIDEKVRQPAFHVAQGIDQVGRVTLRVIAPAHPFDSSNSLLS